MYNRAAYNRTPYNIAANAPEVRGMATLELVATGKGYVRSNPGASTVMLEAITAGGEPSRKRYGGTGRIAIEMASSGFAGKRMFAIANTALLEMIAAGGYIGIYGSDIIHLSGITIPPGSELVIDTDEMTITLDGENAIRYLTNDSVFFTLEPGQNIMSLDGDAQSLTDIYIIWKDRWL